MKSVLIILISVYHWRITFYPMKFTSTRSCPWQKIILRFVENIFWDFNIENKLKYISRFLFLLLGSWNFRSDIDCYIYEYIDFMFFSLSAYLRHVATFKILVHCPNRAAHDPEINKPGISRIQSTGLCCISFLISQRNSITEYKVSFPSFLFHCSCKLFLRSQEIPGPHSDLSILHPLSVTLYEASHVLF